MATRWGDIGLERAIRERDEKAIRERYPEATWLPWDAPDIGARVTFLSSKRSAQAGTVVGPEKPDGGFWQVLWDERRVDKARPGRGKTREVTSLVFVPMLARVR